MAAVQHIFVILMENKSCSQVWNTSSTPYITQLGNTYARATAYYAISHASLPNYLDFVGGDNFGITTDCSPSPSCHISSPSLAHNLNLAGLSWRLYMESMPAPCYRKASGNYAPKHSLAIYFDGLRTSSPYCKTQDVQFSAFAGDLARAAKPMTDLLH